MQDFPEKQCFDYSLSTIMYGPLQVCGGDLSAEALYSDCIVLFCCAQDIYCLWAVVVQTLYKGSDQADTVVNKLLDIVSMFLS